MRLKPVFLVLIFSLVAVIAKSQDITLKGKLSDKDNKGPIAGATVELRAQADSLHPIIVLTDNNGDFVFNGLKADRYRLTTSASGYNIIEQNINLQASNKTALQFTLTKMAKELDEVTVIAKKPVVTQKGDTLQFNADQLKVNPDATAEDLIKKLPGVIVDKNGNVTAAGEQVKKVTVDGRDFFGDDATAALKNLPASVIDKIQVFDKLSDQAAFTGFDDGNSVKAINIVTKTGMRNGQFGRVYAGAGTQGTYNAGGNVSVFKNNMRLTFVGLANNVNQQNFASQDLLGISGGGGRGGRGGFGGFGGGNSFNVGVQNGISKTNSFGINYSDQWWKKVDVSGSYFFNDNNANNNQFSNTQNFLANDTTLYKQQNVLSNTKNYNHRINFRFNYKIDDKNSLMIMPSLSFQTTKLLSDVSDFNSYSPTDSLSKSLNNTNSKGTGYNFNNSILYRHAFAKKGRTISIHLGTAVNKNDGDTYNINKTNYYYNTVNTDDSLQQYTSSISNGYQLSANIAYTEPIGKKGQIQLNYSPSYSKSKSDLEVFKYDYAGNKYSLFVDSLSNKFDNIITKHTTGLSYRIGDRDNMFSVGLNYQYTELNSDQSYPYTANVNLHFNNLLPNLMWRKKINAKNSIRVFYRASTNTPSVSQLQDVINNSDPLYVSKGNPNLKQQVGNMLSTRYTYTNTAKSKSFFANIFLQQNSNYITNAIYNIKGQDTVLSSTVTLHPGSQLSVPVNMNGYWSLRTFLTYSMPLSFIKTNMSINAGLNYSEIPGMIDNIKNKSQSTTYNAGVAFASNISEYVDFNLNYSANFNTVKNTVNPTTKYIQQSAGLQLNLLNKKGWFLQNDISNENYSGLSGGFNQNYWLWNAGIGKKFLKNQAGELKLTVFDLLKQNQSITRTTTASSIQDVQNQVLKQYFMLTFTYNLKNFGTASATNMNNDRERMGPPPHGGGFRPF